MNNIIYLSNLKKILFNITEVTWIYWLFLICLSLQIHIAITIILEENKKEVLKKYSGFSEWSINVPPTLGVLGTIIAISFAIANADIVNPQTFTRIFIKNLYIAVSTTIIGGIIYTINLIVYAFIDYISKK